MNNATHPEQLTRQWFTSVVLGLNLCPFAHKPAREKRIRFVVSEASNEDDLLTECIKEMQWLQDTPIEECETTLLITPELLQDFYDYQFFLEEANRKIKMHHWQGVFQLASFHPDYCFAGSEPENPANLTNRSPFPIIHILREESLTAVLENIENPEEIPEKNMQKMDALSAQEKRELFFYLSSHLK